MRWRLRLRLRRCLLLLKLLRSLLRLLLQQHCFPSLLHAELVLPLEL